MKQLIVEIDETTETKINMAAKPQDRLLSNG